MTNYLQQNTINELSYTVPKLPILTTSNKKDYPEWHNYFKKVYSQDVETDVDLNSFTWFYNFAPFKTNINKRNQEIRKNINNNISIPGSWLGDIQRSILLKDSDKYKLNINEAFIGMDKSIINIYRTLLPRLSLYGFFVNRPFLKDYIKKKNRLEILHVKDDFLQNIAWYWYAKGSGIFIDWDKISTNKKIYNSRFEHNLFTLEIPLNELYVYKFKIEIKQKKEIYPNLNYKEFKKNAELFKIKFNISENGMWLLFDCDIKSNFYLHFATLNKIHIFNDSTIKLYDYKYNPNIFSQSYIYFYWWLDKNYKTLKIYHDSYYENLIKLLESNNPITYITFTTIFIYEIFTILNLCKSQLYSSCILIFKKFPKEYEQKIKKWFIKNNINVQCILFDAKYIIFRVIANNIKSKTIDIYNKYEKSVKVINKRKGGLLWHYGHFLPDCLVDEFRESLHTKYNQILRIDSPDQTIGTFSKYYNNFMKIKTTEKTLEEFENIYCSSKLITGYWQGPYSYNYFNNIYKYAITNFYKSSQKKYDIILIERGTQKLKYNINDVKKMIESGKRKQNHKEYKIVLSGKERRSINDHNYLHKYMETKYKSNFANIILENYSMEEQITIFHNAKLIVGQHGAGLFNLIYCKPGTHIIEIEPILVDVFKELSKSKNLNHTFCKNTNKNVINKINYYNI